MLYSLVSQFELSFKVAFYLLIYLFIFLNHIEVLFYVYQSFQYGPMSLYTGGFYRSNTDQHRNVESKMDRDTKSQGEEERDR